MQTDAELLRWVDANIIGVSAAVARTGLSRRTIQQACQRGEIAGAQKLTGDSRVWLMTYGAVIAWRGRTRAYNRKDA